MVEVQQVRIKLDPGHYLELSSPDPDKPGVDMRILYGGGTQVAISIWALNVQDVERQVKKHAGILLSQTDKRRIGQIIGSIQAPNVRRVRSLNRNVDQRNW